MYLFKRVVVVMDVDVRQSVRPMIEAVGQLVQKNAGEIIKRIATSFRAFVGDHEEVQHVVLIDIIRASKRGVRVGVSEAEAISLFPGDVETDGVVAWLEDVGFQPVPIGAGCAIGTEGRREFGELCLLDFNLGLRSRLRDALNDKRQILLKPVTRCVDFDFHVRCNGYLGSS